MDRRTRAGEPLRTTLVLALTAALAAGCVTVLTEPTPSTDRSPGSTDRPVDVFLARLRHLGKRFLGGRVDGCEVSLR